MRYLLVGQGRMGRAVDDAARRRGHERIGVIDGALDRPGDRKRRFEELSAADVAFEFTRPDAAANNVTALLEGGIPTVCGTTGWSLTPRLNSLLEGAGPGLVLAPNFSLGMNLFARMVQQAAVLCGTAGGFDVAVEEIHHRGKRDLPSGTARRLTERLLEANPGWNAVVEGHADGPLPPGTVQVVGLRVGHEAGTHVVRFDGEHETIDLRHRARGRQGFAVGAVLAAEWLGDRVGLHSFDAIVDELLKEA